MGQLVGKILKIAVCTGFIASATVSHAKELRWTHFGVRPMAMGNAYVAVADDFNALFYNPAGLARLKSWSGELINPTLAISSNTVGAASSIAKLISSGSGKSTEDEILGILQDNTGRPQYFNISETPHLIFPGFGIGLGVSAGASLVVHRDISADVESGIRAVMPIAFAKNYFEDRLSIGASVKLVGRGGVDHTFGINDISAFTNKSSDGSASGAKLEDFVEGGYGVGGDVGVLFTPIKTMQPTLGLSITDIGGTTFKKADIIRGQALGTPATTLPSVNAGVSLKPWQLGSMYLLTSVDAHAVNQPVHYSKKFNLGAEWGWGSVLKVQTGLHQGSLSGGVQLDVFLLTLRFVTYTEQLGTIAGQDANLQDRRYALQLKLLI